MVTPPTRKEVTFSEYSPPEGVKRTVVVINHREIPLTGVRSNEAVNALIATQQPRDIQKRMSLR